MELKKTVPSTKIVKVTTKFNIGDLVSYTYDSGRETIISAVVAISVKDKYINYKVQDTSNSYEWFEESLLTLVNK